MSKPAQGGSSGSCVPQDDEFSAKLDMCLTDGVIKSGAGLLLGTLTSILFFKKRRWPIIGGIGMGIGLAWANCEFTLSKPPEKAKA